MLPGVIIEAAINGGTSKETNPNVPKTAAEVTADALRTLDAGASIIHAHCDPVGGPDDEVAERYLEAFRPVWKERPDALLYPTINFGAGAVRANNAIISLGAGGRLAVQCDMPTGSTHVLIDVAAYFR